MASRRDQIKLTDTEVADFLSSERVMNVASNGRDGWPHVTALWYVMRGVEPWSWTYRKSQKVKNLERDDRVTLLIESGVEYAELKGVMLKTRAHVEHDTERVLDFGEELFAKYQGGTDGEEMREMLRAQAAKRVAIRFEVIETVSWDHSKLGGTY
jgi:nitroimidazol reductase NimA-like FMN-containing flavoprotein (pyridoxamine 5'-phosphate oxidase superfamily)